ncbi:MAG TPA: CBS domain-containing protein [Xanthobacteraceae bacterium]|jgi:CBS domain-containing protein
MRAADIMTPNVITVGPEDAVQDVARLLLRNQISGAPVVDARGAIIGVVSEGDLMRRAEIDTDEKRSWWRRAWAGRERLARDYVRTNARKVADVMSSPAITVGPDTSLREVASLLERKGIKRVPIVDGGKLVGIISRANLLRAFVAFYVAPTAEATSDEEIRERVYSRLRSQHWVAPVTLNVVVDQGVVELWAAVNSEAERKAIRVAAETTPGVTAVKDHVMIGAIPSGY